MMKFVASIFLHVFNVHSVFVCIVLISYKLHFFHSPEINEHISGMNNENNKRAPWKPYMLFGDR